MKNEITRRAAPALPVAVSTEIRQLTTSPANYLENLPAERPSDPRPEGALMLSHCKRSLDRAQQILYISMLIIEVNDFFNVRGNMNQKQIRLTAELILDNPNFYDLTLGNIKACFRQRMMSEKLYDRLDGNIIIQWLREFKSEMADHCETVNEGNDRIRQREETSGDAGSITHAAYMAMLEARANDGDEEAQKMLEDYRQRTQTITPEQRRKKEMDFRKYKLEYLKQKGLYGSTTPKS